jgi:uncharacterized membrane protein YfcA
VFGVVGNLLKVAGFTLVGFSFAAYGSTILWMIPAALVGTTVGQVALSRMEERHFLPVFRLVLAALALKLIVWDGLARLL